MPGPAAAGSRRAKRRRLSRSADFDRAYRHGRSYGNRFLVLYVFPREGDDDARLGLSVSRKVGGAVDRNRVKRLLREAFWQRDRALPGGHDFVIVSRPAARELAEREGLAGVSDALDELLAEARRGAEGGGDEGGGAEDASAATLEPDPEISGDAGPGEIAGSNAGAGSDADGGSDEDTP